MPVNDVLALGEPLTNVMRAAGEIARATARRPFKRWTKGPDRSPVTEGDIAVNEFLHEQLSVLLPDAGWKSEESNADLPDRAVPLAWIVDPIDGTRAYISGSADWSISVALAEGGRPLLAAIYAPVTDEMFLALREGGATLNGIPIRGIIRRNACWRKGCRPQTLSRAIVRDRTCDTGSAQDPFARLADCPRCARGAGCGICIRWQS